MKRILIEELEDGFFKVTDLNTELYTYGNSVLDCFTAIEEMAECLKRAEEKFKRLKKK